MKVLFISNLFPDASQPGRGIYNARLLHQLAGRCSIRVLSPRATLFGNLRGVRQARCRAEDQVFSPVFPSVSYIPKFGSQFNHSLMARGLKSALERDKSSFDVILGSWLYPDGCAARLLAAELKLPLVLVAQGSDVHGYLRMPIRRQLIVRAVNDSVATVARSRELARLLEDAGAEAKKLRVIYNGVDANIFCPGDQSLARNRLQLPPDARVVLFVGNLLPVKNPLLALRAFANLSGASSNRPAYLICVGDGPLQDELKTEVQRLNVANRVILAGRQPEEMVAEYMRASDLLCVPSDNEGMPNVILEALSCGLRVVANRVGGIPEVINHDLLGRLVEKGDVQGMATALAQTLNEKPKTEAILSHIRKFSWESTAEQYLELLNQAVTRNSA